MGFFSENFSVPFYAQTLWTFKRSLYIQSKLLIKLQMYIFIGLAVTFYTEPFSADSDLVLDSE